MDVLHLFLCRGGEQYAKVGEVMWGCCKLQSVLKSFTVQIKVAEAYQHAKLANTRGIWGRVLTGKF